METTQTVMILFKGVRLNNIPICVLLSLKK